MASETKIMSGLNLDWVMCGGMEFSAASPGQLSSPSLAVLWWFLWPWPFIDKVNGLSCDLGISAALDALADCFSDGFEGLVVPPSIPALTQRLGAAAQDVFRMCTCVLRMCTADVPLSMPQ